MHILLCTKSSGGRIVKLQMIDCGYSALHCCLHTEVLKIMFGFICLLQTLLDCHTSGPDLSTLGILNLSHPTLMTPQVLDEMHA